MYLMKELVTFFLQPKVLEKGADTHAL